MLVVAVFKGVLKCAGFAIGFASSDTLQPDGTLPAAEICDIEYASPEAESIFNPQGLIDAKAVSAGARIAGNRYHY